MHEVVICERIAEECESKVKQKKTTTIFKGVDWRTHSHTNNVHLQKLLCCKITMRKAEKWNSEIEMNKCMRKVKRLFVYSYFRARCSERERERESHVERERGQTRRNKVKCKEINKLNELATGWQERQRQA